MILHAKDFTYNGTSLSDINEDFIVISFGDGGHNSDVELLTRTVNRSPVSYDQPITFDYGAVDSDVFTFTLTICHKDGGDITRAEAKELISWLMSPVVPQWLSIEGCGNEVYEDIFYKGRFVHAGYEDISDARKIGMTFNFENIAPYGFTKEYTYQFPTSSGSMSGDIENLGTAVGKTVLPEIRITPNASGRVTINNTADSSVGALSINVTNGQPVILRNYACYLTDGSLYDLDKMDNFNWVVLKDGINTITITGDCTVTMKVRYFEALGV